MNQQPNAIEALSEALRRIYTLQPSGDYTASKWDAYKAVLAYQQELTDACIDRISEGVDVWEEMQHEAKEVAESDALDFVDFMKQCRP